MKTDQNTQLKLAYDFVEYTNKNIFLTGKAGTGKTTFLHELKKVSGKRMVVVAPTGVAAINAGGVTIHSFFQMPFGPHLPAGAINYSAGKSEINYASGHTKISRSKIDVIKSLDLLVIDEISMVRADLLDGIDEVLCKYKRNNKPFGGVQLLMIGDIQQLAPVIKDDEWGILKPYYQNIFFFSSRALQKTNFVSIELKHIYRQSDKNFIDILNRVRDNKTDSETLLKLNQRYKPNITSHNNEGYIILTTHNNKAREINDSKISEIDEKTYTFFADINGEFPEYSYPTDYELTLKQGAQVMFVKNDSSQEKQFYNGKIGVIEDIDEDIIYVQCEGDDAAIAVGKVEWENNKYTIDSTTKEIKETLIGSFIQYPLKLAWAITIHKSQGLTFEKAIIDANASFAHGQVYVALSRCKNLEGLILSSPISASSIKNDSTVLQFSSDIEENTPGLKELISSKLEFELAILLELFDFSGIQRQLNYLVKVIQENSTALLGNLSENFEQMKQLVKTSLIDISEKFKPQLLQIFEQEKQQDNKEVLQSRISKACAYFSDKTKTVILDKLKEITVETDNKAVRKSVTTVLENLQDEIHVKLACLVTCQKNFTVKDYLNTRAHASLEKTTVNQGKKKSEIPPSAIEKNSGLFARLKEWRHNKSTDLNLPAYMIMHQKTLNNIVHFLPASIEQLTIIKGFGKKKATDFGEEILEIILAYCNEQNIEIKPDELILPKSKPGTKPKTDTKQISFELFKAGKPVEEIASERGMTVSTIEGHLAHYIGLGEIDIHTFVKPEKVVLISNYLRTSKTTLLNKAKEDLGAGFTYGEIKMVMKHLEVSKS